MRTLIHLIAIGVMLVSGSAGAAELYKWVDERGVTNYSSDPPPKGRTAKPIAEDLVSVYTPEAAVTQAIEAERHRRTAPPPAPAAQVTLPPPVSAPGGVIAPPVARAVPYDPCLTGNDPNCYAPTIYDSSPVFVGRQRPPILHQPQLPAGAIAGNVTGTTGVTPGLSGMTPPVAPAPAPRGNMPRRPTSSTWREFSAQ